MSNFKIAVKLAAFAAMVLLALNFVGGKYSEASGHNIINYFNKARYDEFYAAPKNSIDMIFVGSSHSYCTFDPENFDSVYNTSSYQLGTPLQHADTTYYVLKEAFNYQSPKIVVMELYWDVLDDDFEMKQAQTFFDALKNEQIYNEYVNKGFPINERVKYKFKPIRYQQDYFQWKSSSIKKYLENRFGVWQKNTDDAQGEEYYVKKGYVYCDIVLPESEYDETNQYKNLDGQKWEASDVQIKWLDKIVELCNEKGAELVFVTAPVANVSMEYIKNYEYIHSFMAKYAESKGKRYIDYNIVNAQEKMLENENFRDDAHLNDSGVKIVDEHFGKWLFEK